MAMTRAELLIALYEMLGGSLSADSTKATAIEKARDEAFVEAQVIFGPESTSGSAFAILWQKLAMYKMCMVAIGPGQASRQLWDEYSQYYDLVMNERYGDASTVYDPAA